MPPKARKRGPEATRQEVESRRAIPDLSFYRTRISQGRDRKTGAPTTYVQHDLQQACMGVAMRQFSYFTRSSSGIYFVQFRDPATGTRMSPKSLGTRDKEEALLKISGDTLRNRLRVAQFCRTCIGNIIFLYISKEHV